MAEHIVDPNFRPAGYFGPKQLERYLLGRVKGVVARQRLEELIAIGGIEEAMSVVGPNGLDAELRKVLERLHPMFMGGNYLPDTERGEVVIASITLASTLSDVTCVYARFSGGRIHYRVVDEYEGEMLTGPARRTSTKPLTLRQLTDFFFGGWDLLTLLQDYDDLEEQLEFFHGSSDFYPEFDAYCRQLVVAQWEQLNHG